MSNAEQLIQNKITAQAKQLFEDHTAVELQGMYQHAFGIATKLRDKTKLSERIATHLVTGNGVSDENASEDPAEKSPSPVVSDLQPSQKDPAEISKLAHGILTRVKSAWDELDALSEQKKTALAEFRQQVGASRDAINGTLTDPKLDEAGKLRRVEGYWQSLVNAERQMTETRKDYNERIKASKQTVRAEMDNTNQLALF